jgi:hypothetical protein
MQLLVQCKLSNEPLGVIATLHPSAFSELSAVHPFFNLSLHESAKRLANEVKNGVTDSSRILFLSTVHKLTQVRQDFPGTPTIEKVEEFSPNLLTLVDWKLRVPSLIYPALHISKFNSGFDCLENWVLTSLEIKSKAAEQIAEAEAKLLSDLELSRTALALSGKPSLNKLWKYISEQLRGTKYEPDSYGWLRTLFLSKSQSEILYFDRQEILMACEIIESSLPLGIGLGPSIRKRLNELKETINGYYLDIEEVERSIEVESQESFAARQKKREDTLAKITISASLVEPKREDFSSNISFLIAKAQFALASKSKATANSQSTLGKKFEFPNDYSV